MRSDSDEEREEKKPPSDNAEEDETLRGTENQQGGNPRFFRIGPGLVHHHLCVFLPHQDVGFNHLTRTDLRVKLG